LKTVADGESSWLSVAVVGLDPSEDENRAFLSRHGLKGLRLIASPDIASRYSVGTTPYAVLIDSEGLVRAKGLVNSREHVESLFAAMESGYATMEGYVRDRDSLAVGTGEDGKDQVHESLEGIKGQAMVPDPTMAEARAQ